MPSAFNTATLSFLCIRETQTWSVKLMTAVLGRSPPPFHVKQNHRTMREASPMTILFATLTYSHETSPMCKTNASLICALQFADSLKKCTPPRTSRPISTGSDSIGIHWTYNHTTLPALGTRPPGKRFQIGQYQHWTEKKCKTVEIADYEKNLVLR